MEILKDFSCSDVELKDKTTFMQTVVGNNCTVLGERIPRMRLLTFPPGVQFDGFCPPYNIPADPNRPDVGRQVQARLNARIKELSQQVFQGKAEGRLEGNGRDRTGHQCAFVLSPILN